MLREEGVVAPFVPSPPSALRWLRKNIGRLIGTGERQAVVYEAGCGEGAVARLIAGIAKSYTVCVELNRNRVEGALALSREMGLDHLVEHVQGDLTSFFLRRIDIAYAYLFPHAMEPLYRNLPPGAFLVSLDFPVPGLTPREYYDLGPHGIYVYRKEKRKE